MKHMQKPLVIISVLFAFNACGGPGHITEMRVTNESSYHLNVQILERHSNGLGFSPRLLMQGYTARFLYSTESTYGSHINPAQWRASIVFSDLSDNLVKALEITDELFMLVEISVDNGAEHAIYLLEITDELLGISSENPQPLE
jgi:hypothetical protein